MINLSIKLPWKNMFDILRQKLQFHIMSVTTIWMLLEKNGEFGMATKVEVEFIKSYYIDLKQTNKVNYTTSKYKTIYYYK